MEECQSTRLCYTCSELWVQRSSRDQDPWVPSGDPDDPDGGGAPATQPYDGTEASWNKGSSGSGAPKAGRGGAGQGRGRGRGKGQKRTVFNLETGQEEQQAPAAKKTRGQDAAAAKQKKKEQVTAAPKKRQQQRAKQQQRAEQQQTEQQPQQQQREEEEEAEQQQPQQKQQPRHPQVWRAMLQSFYRLTDTLPMSVYRMTYVILQTD